MCKVKNEGEATLLLEKLWEYDLDENDRLFTKNNYSWRQNCY